MTPSLYERTTSPQVLKAQGCQAGRAGTNGIVVLDFGKPDHRRSYGTLTFAGTFASSTSITWALDSYALGYSRCLAKRSTAKLVLAGGTSNYDLNVPSPFTAGRVLARETREFAAFLREHHFDDHVQAAAADDIEPAWDPSFRRTYAFLRGFRAADKGDLLYDYGSLDGGVGSIWSLRQAYYVASGMRYARALPEIYNTRMASEWADLSDISVKHFGTPVSFAGIMTCDAAYGFSARQAAEALVSKLQEQGKTRIPKLPAITSITPAPFFSSRLAHLSG